MIYCTASGGGRRGCIFLNMSKLAFFSFLQGCKHLFDINIFAYVKKISYGISKLQHFMYKQYIAWLLWNFFFGSTTVHNYYKYNQNKKAMKMAAHRFGDEVIKKKKFLNSSKKSRQRTNLFSIIRTLML